MKEGTYYSKNKERVKARDKAYRAANLEKVRKQARDGYYRNHENIMAKNLENRPKRKEYARQYYLLNKERVKKKVKEYTLKNPEKVAEGHRKHHLLTKEHRNKLAKERKKVDLQYLLATGLRSRMSAAVRRGIKNGSAVRDLGCSLAEFKFYLEGKFKDGMSWENYGHVGDVWHIDHIVPLAFFDLTDKKQLLQACHYTNLQPLWAMENLKKGNKITHG